MLYMFETHLHKQERHKKRLSKMDEVEAVNSARFRKVWREDNSCNKFGSKFRELQKLDHLGDFGFVNFARWKSFPPE